MNEFVLATANPGKQREISAIFGPTAHLLPRPESVGAVEESGDTLIGNARLKAETVARATGRPAIADDTGLEVTALDGRPGVHSARYAGDDATADMNVAKLLDEMSRIGGDRSARFRTVAMVVWPDGSELLAEGTVCGVIVESRRGSRGFGYDPVFAPDESDGRTFAEMDPAEKNAVSHRGRAFRDLARILSERED